MVGFLLPFAGRQTLERTEPKFAGGIQFGTLLTCTFSPAIAYGDTNNLAAWLVDQGSGFREVNAIQVTGGTVRLTLPSSVLWRTVRFLGLPTLFRATSGAALQAFEGGS